MKRTNSWVRWTDIEIARLTQLVNDGNLTVAEIAADLGKSFLAVADKKRRLGLCTPHKLSTSCPKTLAEIIKFKMAGWNLTEIAKVYDMSEPSISRILCANGFKRFLWASPQYTHPFRHWSELELHRLRKCLIKGDSLDHICMYFPSRSRNAIRKRARKMTRYWLSPEQLAERERARRRFLRLPEEDSNERWSHRGVEVKVS